MIKTLSPYYVTVPFVDPLTSSPCVNYTLRIYVWNGNKASVPATPSYVMTKTNATNSSASDKVNISRLINDFIDFKPRVVSGVALIDADNQVWCKTTISYDGGVEQLGVTKLCLKGYNYGMDGENATIPMNNILLQGDEFKVNRNGIFVLPLLSKDTAPSLGNAIVKSYPSNEINETFPIAVTTHSGQLVQNVCIDLSQTFTDTYLEIEFNGETITLLIQDECRYTPLDVAFQNKEGALQFITFFKAKTESINITSEQFESDRGQPIFGNHQYVTYNVQGRSKFKINSGFVSEAMNETFKQLMLSERVWTYQGGVFTPIKLGTQSLEYKTRMKDRLINYEVEFEYAFNEVNNV